MTNEDAIRVFESWIERDENLKYADRLENIEIYQTAIEALKAQRPRGEWIKESLQIDEHHFRSYAKCKVCGCSFKPYSFAVKEFDFCPKCGAKMKEGDEK